MKLKVIVQELDDNEEVLNETSIISPDAPSDEECHEVYTELTRMLLDMMEDDEVPDSN